MEWILRTLYLNFLLFESFIPKVLQSIVWGNSDLQSYVRTKTIPVEMDLLLNNEILFLTRNKRSRFEILQGELLRLLPQLDCQNV